MQLITNNIAACLVQQDMTMVCPGQTIKPERISGLADCPSLTMYGQVAPGVSRLPQRYQQDRPTPFLRLLPYKHKHPRTGTTNNFKSTAS